MLMVGYRGIMGYMQHVPISTRLLGKPTSWSYCITSLDSIITASSTPIDPLTSPQANELPEELFQVLPPFLSGLGGRAMNKLGHSEHSLDPLLMYLYYLSFSVDGLHYVHFSDGIFLLTGAIQR